MSKPTILLTDDTKLFLALEQEFLRATDALIITASNGREAFETARSRRPDLIYMDLNMPEMDGATCCAALKADPELSQIPVIMVTTAGRDDDIEMCKKAGCDGFLTKPIDRRLFLEMGRRFLSGINRRERRIYCQLSVLFRMRYENQHGNCINLGLSGMYISYDGEVALGDDVEASFMVAGSSSSLVEVWGKVVWVNMGSTKTKQELPDGFGMEFLEMTNESREMIRKFLGQMP